MARIFLVDSENIGSLWSRLLPIVTQEDKMFVYYTEHSPYISYDHLLQIISYCKIPEFVKCYEGKNALDFQLVSELGFKLSQYQQAEFVIVSDDLGYDAAIRYWTERGYNVRRVGKKLCRPMTFQPKAEIRNQESVVLTQAMMAVSSASEADISEMRASEERYDAETVQEDVVPGTSEVVAEDSDEEVFVLTELQGDELQKASAVSQESDRISPYENQQEAHQDTITENRKEIPQVSESQEELQESTPVGDGEEVAFKAASEKVAKAPGKVARERRARSPKKAEVKAETKAEVHAETEADVKAQTSTAAVSDESVKTGAVSEVQVPAQAVTASVTSVKAPDNPQNNLKNQISAMVNKCGSLQPDVDTDSVYEMFCTLKMSNLTVVNTALKILIGNELGNDIYRELKEHQECRAQLDALYYPSPKDRFIHYVKIVLDRSQLRGMSEEEIGRFLLGIPRKNLNSIRSAMLKQYGHELGSEIYTLFKSHIKVLNKI